jgi:hypothetical protein
VSRKRKDIPTLRHVVDRKQVEAAKLANLDLFADPAAGIPDPNALRHELAVELTARIEAFVRQATKEMERKLVDRLHHELPAIVEQAIRDHFNKNRQ